VNRTAGGRGQHAAVFEWRHPDHAVQQFPRRPHVVEIHAPHEGSPYLDEPYR